jgi:hypothetical protein
MPVDLLKQLARMDVPEFKIPDRVPSGQEIIFGRPINGKDKGLCIRKGADTFPGSRIPNGDPLPCACQEGSLGRPGYREDGFFFRFLAEENLPDTA